MRTSVAVGRGIESLFGTRDENLRLLETGLRISARLDSEAIEIEGEATQVARAEAILLDYFDLVKEGVVFKNGDLNSMLRVVTADAGVSLRGLVESGRART